MTAFTYHLMQDGLRVASASATTDEAAHRAILHYAAVYSQDGPVKIVKGHNLRRKTTAAPPLTR